jgi:hypothetical protein
MPQGRVSTEDAAAMLCEPQLQASDLLPHKYEGERRGRQQLTHVVLRRAVRGREAHAGRH